MHINYITGVICRKLKKNQQQNFSVARECSAAHTFNSRSTAKEKATSWQMENAKKAAIIKDFCWIAPLLSRETFWFDHTKSQVASALPQLISIGDCQLEAELLPASSFLPTHMPKIYSTS